MMYIQKNIYKMLILIRRVYNILYYIKNTSVNINSILFSKKQHTQKPPSPFYVKYHVLILYADFIIILIYFRMSYYNIKEIFLINALVALYRCFFLLCLF